MGFSDREFYQLLKKWVNSSTIINTIFKDRLRYWVLLLRESHYKKLTEPQKEKELKKWYFRQTGEQLNLDSPENFNQKIQWLKLKDNIPQNTILSDKYMVRKWIKEKIGEQYLIPIYGVWDNSKAIDFNTLPSCFVLKANHGSGMNYIVRDKSEEDYNKLRKMTQRWLRTPYDLSSMEQQYYGIPRRIIAEEYIEQSDGNLYDYKIHCFSGEPKIIQVIGNRDLLHHTAKECYLDLNWKRNSLMYNTYQQYDTIPSEPSCLNEMIKIAKKLSKDFIYVRVDLYVIDDKVKFGEMTFTPAAGIGKWGGAVASKLVGDMIIIEKKEDT